jgi:predicted MPP superfamily phosphohydrolase
MLMKQKSDVIFFTGDLVNGQTPEVKYYMDVFDKVRAPLGVLLYIRQPRLWRLRPLAISCR